ncbi:hypothetical protein SAMN06295905_0595 [Devosia lucknowensis]|uniref:Uncharacterized protein n=1 Tax=Devosia lucknowensis TaxID=1096929 RepID=A0A1Y6EP44_9HYPH|nr:hypothetical protein [Devosia lucknowensis]SMQ61953.1 hypothetical protein SAMN06295905_0595 [Devosia lucknowensis]
MQLDENSSAMLIDHITDTLETMATDFNDRLADLEALAGVKVLEGFDEDQTNYRVGQLCTVGGGSLLQWTAEKKWRPVVNGIEKVWFEGDTLMIERWDGTIQKSQIKKATRAKPVKVETV